jgi:hypothetical protein
MSMVVVALVLVVVVGLVAFVLERRRVDAPTQGSWTVPAQLDRTDFVRSDAPWLVALFTSSTCGSCAGTADKALVLECEEVAVAVVPYQEQADLHRRYASDAVPTVVVADGRGVVHASFVGPPTATDLWAAVAEAREPGSSPEPDLGR